MLLSISVIEEIDKNDEEIDKVLILAKQCLKDGKKQVAKTHLRLEN